MCRESIGRMIFDPISSSVDVFAKIIKSAMVISPFHFSIELPNKHFHGNAYHE